MPQDRQPHAACAVDAHSAAVRRRPIRSVTGMKQAHARKRRKKTPRCRPRRAFVPPGPAPRQADEADIFLTVRRRAANPPLRRRNVSKTKRAGAAGASHAELAPSGLVVRNLSDTDRSGQATAAAIPSDLQFHDAGNRVVGHLKYSSKIGHRALFPIVISRNILRAHPFLVPMRGCLDASVTVRPFPRLFYGRGRGPGLHC